MRRLNAPRNYSHRRPEPSAFSLAQPNLRIEASMTFALRPPLFATLACAVGLSGCAAGPPQELGGLWARGEGGCQTQTGFLFERDAVRFVAGEASEVVLRDPYYTVAADGDVLHITIRYALAPGLFGPQQAAEVDLTRGPDGWLAVTAHRTADGRRGYARLRSPDADPLYALLHTKRCGEGAWIEDLRGRPSSEDSASRAQENAVGREPDGEGAGTESGGGRPTPQAAVDQLRGRAAELQDSSWLEENTVSPAA